MGRAGVAREYGGGAGSPPRKNAYSFLCVFFFLFVLFFFLLFIFNKKIVFLHKELFGA